MNNMNSNTDDHGWEPAEVTLVDTQMNPLMFEDLAGQPWEFKKMDCLEVVRLVVMRINGKVIPHFDYDEDWYEKGFDHFAKNWREVTVPVSLVLPGDLMFFKLHKKVVNHVAVYVGERKILHSFQKTGVILSPFEKFKRFFVFAGRVK